MSAAARHWLAVASAEHVERGVAGGFMQVCHGKAAPLRRIRPGDEIAYYSPARSFGSNDSLRAFTACGVVLAGDPYVFEMDGGFRPFRRDVAWRAAGVAPIRPLLGELEFAAGTSNWGYRLRFGWSEISAHDMALIRRALGVCHSDASARPGAR